MGDRRLDTGGRRSPVIPRAFKADGHAWQVQNRQRITFEGDLCWGKCLRDRYRILLRTGMRSRRAFKVFVHEALHASIPEDLLPLWIEEEIVERMTETMTEIMKATVEANR